MDIDVVIIGVNAEKTLKRCLQSVFASNYTSGTLAVHYVDGGSIDSSIAIARSFKGVQTVELTPMHPTPGMQRNAGWRNGSAPAVLFLDSDTVLDSRFITQAVNLFEQQEGNLGAVFGNRMEEAPHASVYNWIGSLEWNPPQGFVEAFGGDVLVLRKALEDTGGYDEELVGGEDPELGVRFGLSGWKIYHADIPMTLHDLAIYSLRQHSKRAFRTGYGYAAVALRHARKAKGFWLYELGRIIIRGGLGILFLLTSVILALSANTLSATLFLMTALLLLLYPRLFSIQKFQQQKGISKADAIRYSWHCALAVVPQFFGVCRFLLGAVTGRPLRNKSSSLATRSLMLFLLLILLIPLTGCGSRVSPNVSEDVPEQEVNGTMSAQKRVNAKFTREAKKLEDFASAALIQQFSDTIPEDYLIGPGDVLSLEVWNRPNLSDKEIVVAPDGTISVMRLGILTAAGKSLQELTDEVRQGFSKYYSMPEVRITIKTYRNNKAFVLGRVTNPGLIEFSGQGTLLEALSLAGGLPILRQEAFLTKCAIIRGKNQVIWVDLRDLLQNGNMALNARIQNNDIIFIPESEDELIYVMGEVQSPGAIRLKSKLTYLDALMFSGGPTEDADLEKTYIIRFDAEKRTIKQINLKNMLENGDGSQNFVLRDNDVVYVAENGMANFNYHVRQLLPSLEVMNLGTSVMERFGTMQDLRRKWYGTQGFVNGE